MYKSIKINFFSKFCSSKASSEYAGASGGASVFFGAGQAGNAHFEINKIAISFVGNQMVFTTSVPVDDELMTIYEKAYGISQAK